MPTHRPRQMTWEVELPGKQDRLKEAVLYVSKACQKAEYFGLIKLNKILWRADFTAFAERGQPVTGRMYQRLPLGPAPVEMVPVLNKLLSGGFLELERRTVIDFDEMRPVPLAEPILQYFSPDDLRYLDASIEHYWNWTGRVTSETYHGIAWSTHNLTDIMPYESSYLSDDPVNPLQARRLLALAIEKGWNSQ